MPTQVFKTAPDLLHDGVRMLAERGKDRDKDKERSMGRIVAAFKAITGNDLSERDGWFFMACVKLVRAGTTASGREDDYIDGLNYMALAGESVADTFPEPKQAVLTKANEDMNVLIRDKYNYPEVQFGTGVVHGNR